MLSLSTLCFSVFAARIVFVYANHETISIANHPIYLSGIPTLLGIGVEMFISILFVCEIFYLRKLKTVVDKGLSAFFMS